MTAKIETALTVADLELMPDDGNRYELIDGEIQVSRTPTLWHQRVSGNLFESIRNYLRGNPIGEVLATPGVVFDEVNGVIPDLVFLSNERRDEIASGDRIVGAPDLMIEILSPGSENVRRDRVIKRQQYEKFGVTEYWIVDMIGRTIDIYRLTEQELTLVNRLTEQDNITSIALPRYSCRVESIFGN